VIIKNLATKCHFRLRNRQHLPKISTSKRFVNALKQLLF
jgi:hypothetical protein